MMGYAFVDYFNLGLWPRHREPTFADIRDGLESLVTALTTASTPQGSSPAEVLLRLYGGWYEEAFDVRVPLRELTAAVVRDFPRRVGSLRIVLELAETPIWNRALPLLSTVRRVTPKPVPMKVLTPSGCPHGGSCSLVHLQAWWRGACPDASCAVRVQEVGWTHRQKMVDTLLTADVLNAASRGLADCY